MKCGLPPQIAVKGKVGDGGVLGDCLSHIFQGEGGCFKRDLGGADVIALRVAEDERLRREVVDGGLAEWEAVGWGADARASNEVWNVCVLKLG